MVVHVLVYPLVAGKSLGEVYGESVGGDPLSHKKSGGAAFNVINHPAQVQAVKHLQSLAACMVIGVFGGLPQLFLPGVKYVYGRGNMITGDRQNLGVVFSEKLV